MPAEKCLGKRPRGVVQVLQTNGINPNNACGKVVGKEATRGCPGSTRRGIVKSRGNGYVMYVTVSDVSLNTAQGVCVGGA